VETEPDVVHDLNETPWPFPDSSFQTVYVYDVIEHLENVVQIMEEIHRISRSGARVHITVPHFSCANAFTDPTHRHYFGYSSFDYFTEGHGLCFYNYARFQRRTARLIFYPTILSNDCLAPSESFSGGLRTPLGMDFPAWYLQFELEVVK